LYSITVDNYSGESNSAFQSSFTYSDDSGLKDSHVKSSGLTTTSDEDLKKQNVIIENFKTTVHSTTQVEKSKNYIEGSSFMSSGSGIRSESSTDSIELSGKTVYDFKNSLDVEKTDREELPDNYKTLTKKYKTGANLVEKTSDDNSINGKSLRVESFSRLNLKAKKDQKYFIKQHISNCKNGEASYSRRCVCDVGYSGELCDISLFEESTTFSGESRESSANDVVESGVHNSFIDFDIMKNEKKVKWVKITKKVDPYIELVRKENVVHGFVKVSRGMKGTGSSLKFSPDGKHYKFLFRPRKNIRSRLELSTCFVLEEDYKKLGKNLERLNLNYPSMLQHLCQVVNKPIEAVHTYKYNLYVDSKDWPETGSYIMAQWHGTSDGKILRDDSGCVARVTDEDLVSLCQDGFCEKGVIFLYHIYN